jgi:glutathione peroxidase
MASLTSYNPPDYYPFMKTTLLLLASMAAMTLSASAAEPAPLLQIPLKDIDGKDASLQQYGGKVLLLVNVASKCGYTPQYEGLESLWRAYKDRGLVVLGFPCNDFGGQEPGTNEEIKTFCSSRYDVSFPLFDKLHVKGPEQHPLYLRLTGPTSPVPGPVKWNFGKFLVGRDGTILARFGSDTEPDSAKLRTAIDDALAAK